jgi:hypothetical protein
MAAANSVFKNIVVAAQIEEATINQLVKWFPTYIREMERLNDLPIGEIPYPKYYTNRNSFDIQPGEDWPKVVVISPGLAEAPTAKGDGQYYASWRLGVGVGCAATSESYGNLLSKVYGAAVRAIMVHKQSLGGLAQVIRWIEESYDDLPIPSQNQLFKAAAVYFHVECEDVVTKWAGPAEPDEEPYGFGLVEHIYIELVKEPIDAKL